jgi:hypothetical protein
VKPRLLPDTHFLPTESGLSVRAPGHEASVHAPGLYPWFERVRPFLDGEHSVVDLVDKLSPPAAQRVLGLIEFLLREGFARDAAFDVPHSLTPATLDLHAGMIEFIARLVDSPERRFQSYRECAPVVVGSGLLLTATALALTATGVEHVRVHAVAPDAAGETRTDRASLDESVAPLLRRDPAARLEFFSAEPADLPVDAGALLYVSDQPDASRVTRLRALAARRGLRYGTALVSGDRVAVGPVSVPDARSRPEPGTFSPPGRHFGGPAAAVAAHRLCLNLLRHAAGLLDLDPDGGEEPALLDLSAASLSARIR